MTELAYLEKVDPSRRMMRFYSIWIAPTLFGEWAMVREWGRVGSHVEETSEAPHLDGTASAIPSTGDPGFWNLNPPSLQRISVLRAELEDERLPQFTRVRLL
jgi:hypothetical protein